MQEAIVKTAMEGKHVLGILPTGVGKSVCYQVLALSRYDKTGALTICRVIFVTKPPYTAHVYC